MEFSSWIWILVLLVTWVSFKRNSSVVYYAKFVFFQIYFIVLGAVALPIIFLTPKKKRNVGVFFPYLLPLSKILGIEWEIRGKNVLETDFPCVIIFNHQTCLDALAVVEVINASKGKNLTFIAKKILMYVFPPGYAGWLCHVIFIDRSNGPKAQQEIADKLAKFAEDNVNMKIVIFPEGTRNKGTSLLPFKKGAFHIAHQNKLPIVPIVISPTNFVNHEQKIFGTGKIAVSILDPIPTEGLKLEDINSLVDTTREKMNTEFQKLCKEFN